VISFSAVMFSLKDALIVAAVSGITTLNVGFHYASPYATDQLFSSQVFLSGALTVALPSIGKDLNFKQVRVT
jgi:hypothetical protein